MLEMPEYFAKQFLSIAMDLDNSPLMREALRRNTYVVLNLRRKKATKVKLFDSITRAKKYAKKLKNPIITESI